MRARYRTSRGTMYEGDALELLGGIRKNSVQAIITSPPFALRREKAYGNPPADEYVAWMMPFAAEFLRVLKPDGSLVIELGGSWLPGSPTRSIYQFELLVALVRDLGFHLAEEFYWYNRAKLPGPAQWVNIERIRVKDAVNPIWWLSKTPRPKANNRAVLTPYSNSQRRLMRRGSYNTGPRPSEHVIGDGFTKDNGGAIPPNIIEVPNTRSADGYQTFCRDRGLVIHPARFPREIPEFFVRFLTDRGDTVLDPFAGSNMTGAVAERAGRRWRAFEMNGEYIDGSVGRFESVEIVRPLGGRGALS